MLITTGTCYEFTLGREGHWPPATLQDRFERLNEKSSNETVYKETPNL